MADADNPPFDPQAMVAQRVVLADPRMDAVRVQRGLEYRVADGEPLHFNLYLPPSPAAAAGSGVPIVLLVLGYSDRGARQIFGCDVSEFAAYDGWARLIACRGIAAITYQTVDPTADVATLYEFLKAEAGNLALDVRRVGVWSCSGNVPNALGFIAGRPELRCAVLCYGYTLDLDGRSDIADAAKQFGFVVPQSPHGVEGMPAVPLLLVRAGRDATPGLNDSLDRFHAAADARGLPVRMIGHAEGPHAFDIFDDSDESRAVITQVLGFLEAQLLA